MRLFMLAALTAALAGCGTGPISLGTTPVQQQSAQPTASADPSADPSANANGNTDAAVALVSGAALKAALEAVGITDVRPVVSETQLGAWASVPAMKACPVFFRVNDSTSYSVTHMMNTKGEVVALNAQGTPLSPTAADLAKLLVTDYQTYAACVSNTAPESWPVTIP